MRRYTGGLSVFTFLRIRTWMNIENKTDAQDLVKDCVRLARMEGLEGHARAAECRLITNEQGENGTSESGDHGLNNSTSPSKKARM